MLELIMIHVLMQVQPIINGSFANITDQVSLLKAENNTSALGGFIGLGILLTIFIILTIVFSFRIMIINAALVSSTVVFIVSLFFVQIGLLGTQYTLLFMMMPILFAMISLARGLLQPYS